MSKLQYLSEDIIKLVLINIKTEEEKTLTKTKTGRCHLLEKPIKFGKYFIMLRLDWHEKKGLDQRREPTLDTDIWTEKDGKKIYLKKKDSEWHHTPYEWDENSTQFIYKFKFQDFKLELFTKKTFSKNLVSKSVISLK